MAEKQSWQDDDKSVKTAHLYEMDEKGNSYRCPYCQAIIHGKQSTCPMCRKRIKCGA